MDADNASAYKSLATIQEQQGQIEDAASTYQTLVRNQPSAGAYKALAQVLARLGRHDEARQQMAKAKAMEDGARGPQ